MRQRRKIRKNTQPVFDLLVMSDVMSGFAAPEFGQYRTFMGS